MITNNVSNSILICVVIITYSLTRLIFAYNNLLRIILWMLLNRTVYSQQLSYLSIVSLHTLFAKRSYIVCMLQTVHLITTNKNYYFKELTMLQCAIKHRRELQHLIQWMPSNGHTYRLYLIVLSMLCGYQHKLRIEWKPFWLPYNTKMI